MTLRKFKDKDSVITKSYNELGYNLKHLDAALVIRGVYVLRIYHKSQNRKKTIDHCFAYFILFSVLFAILKYTNLG